MRRLEGKTAIITGAAGGIGAATARRFVREGARVLAVDRDGASLAALQTAVHDERLSTFAADCTDPDQTTAYVRAAVDRFGGIDIAFLNAGIGGPRLPIEDYPIEAFDQVLAINLRGAWLGLRAVIPAMKKRGGGSIVLTSSIQGLAAIAGTTGYTTSKHALIGMMKGAALELAPHHIRVNAINPGFVDTPLMDRIHREAAPDNPEAVREALSRPVPLGRYAKPEEIAQLLVFLASDESSYSTGACFLADGGILAAIPS